MGAEGAPYPESPFEKGGPPQVVGFTAAYAGLNVVSPGPFQTGPYNVSPGKLSKRFAITVTEVDKGTLGQDDEGFGTLTFELAPTMAPSTKSTSITLHRPNMQGKPLSEVEVTMTAQLA